MKAIIAAYFSLFCIMAASTAPIDSDADEENSNADELFLSMTKRAAALPLRDLCKFYGLKCKRSGDIPAIEMPPPAAVPTMAPADSADGDQAAAVANLGEADLYDFVINSFLEHCSKTGQCDFYRFLDSIQKSTENNSKNV